MWFPMPAGPDDIRLAGPAATLSPRQLFELLHARDAVEWRDKVGVAGPVDGSGKDSTRLLASRDWVLKTRIDLGVADETEAVERTTVAVRTGIQTQIWHDDKVWACFRCDDRWYPLSATPLMQTNRQLDGEDAKIDAWTSMLLVATEVATSHGIGMDLNPANFGHRPGDPKLYYIDDEWYPSLRYSDLASAAVARIPEEPNICASRWRSWGAVLAKIFEVLCDKHSERNALVDAFRDYPILPKFHPSRDALVEGLKRIYPKKRKSSAVRGNGEPRGSSGQRRTAIIADIHGNLPAFEAVLKECKHHDVDSYIFLGDVVGYGPQPKECIQRLAELPNALYVRGNHDHAISIGVFKEGMNGVARQCAKWTYDQITDEHRDWLMALPTDEFGEGWLAVHGAPKDPRRFLAYVYELTYQDNLEFMVREGLQLCFHGHTHVQSVYEYGKHGACKALELESSIGKLAARTLLINPGSVGQPRDRDTRAAFAVWDRLSDEIAMLRVAYPVSRVVDKIARLGLPSKLGERLLAGE